MQINNSRDTSKKQIRYVLSSYSHTIPMLVCACPVFMCDNGDQAGVPTPPQVSASVPEPPIPHGRGGDQGSGRRSCCRLAAGEGESRDMGLIRYTVKPRASGCFFCAVLCVGRRSFNRKECHRQTFLFFCLSTALVGQRFFFSFLTK